MTLINGPRRFPGERELAIIVSDGEFPEVPMPRATKTGPGSDDDQSDGRNVSALLGTDVDDRLTAIVGMALELFNGDMAEAGHWLSTPKPALGGHRPFELAQTEVGAREVEDLIGRLLHGVFT